MRSVQAAPMPSRRACLLAGLLLAAAWTQHAAGKYQDPGPFAVASTDTAFVLPKRTHNCSSACRLAVRFTGPVASVNGSALSLPLVLWFNGYQASAPQYSGWMNHVASWGYVVLAYTLPKGGIAPFSTPVYTQTELKYLPPLLAWARRQRGPAAAADFSRLATAGHSRGGRLAALHRASPPPGYAVETSVLIDPVDATVWAPTSRTLEPSGVEAVAAASPNSTRTAALVVGAGVQGLCNSGEYGYRRFYEAHGEGSWLLTQARAGAGLYANFDRLNTHASCLLCGCAANCTDLNPDCANGVVREAAATAAAWLDIAFRPDDATAGRVESFLQWLAGRAAGGASFEVKPGGG